jgi:hypothetical protein
MTKESVAPAPEGSKPNRTAVSTRTRFEIFKRDGFRCTYCGRTPVQSKLHVDHVKPVADGGSNAPENLVTACADCNHGKSDVPLDRKRFSVGKVTEADLDHAQQIREWLAIQRDVADARDQVGDLLAHEWDRRCGSGGERFCKRFLRLINEFDVGQLLEAFDSVGNNAEPNETDQIKYLYGIMRRWRNGETEAPKAKPVHPIALVPKPPLRSRHLERCCKHVFGLLDSMNSKAALAGPLPVRDFRIELLTKFARAAWGSPDHFAYIQDGGWDANEMDIRGLNIEFRDGRVWLRDVQDFNPYEAAFQAIRQSVEGTWVNTHAPGEFVTVDSAKEEISMLYGETREWSVWLRLFTGDVDEDLENLRDDPVTANWELE